VAGGTTGSGPPLAAEVTLAAGTATVVLRGDLDPVTMPLLARLLAQVLAGRPQRLVLDMAGVAFLDCASARLIAGTGRHLPDGVRPAVRCPSPVTRRVLELTGLADHLDIGGNGLSAAPGYRRHRVTGGTGLPAAPRYRRHRVTDGTALPAAPRY
jgi:anti-sigma B factor antagonist